MVEDYIVSENFGLDPNIGPLLLDDDHTAKEIMEKLQNV